MPVYMGHFPCIIYIIYDPTIIIIIIIIIQVLQNDYKLEDCLGSFPSIALSPSLTVGEIRQCFLNSAITELKHYDIYR